MTICDKYFKASQKASPKASQNRIVLVVDSEVYAEVKIGIEKFIDWLQSEYLFPEPLTLHLSSDFEMKDQEGYWKYAFFPEGKDKSGKPLIIAAVGDFAESAELSGKFEIICSYIKEILHEIVHYFQWCDDPDRYHDRGVEIQAGIHSKKILQQYLDSLFYS